MNVKRSKTQITIRLAVLTAFALSAIAGLRIAYRGWTKWELLVNLSKSKSTFLYEDEYGTRPSDWHKSSELLTFSSRVSALLSRKIHYIDVSQYESTDQVIATVELAVKSGQVHCIALPDAMIDEIGVERLHVLISQRGMQFSGEDSVCSK